MSGAFKAFLRLCIVAAIAHATWRLGSAYAVHYRFQDSVQETTQFRGVLSDEDVKRRILELAAHYELPLGEDDVTVRTEGEHTIVDMNYAKEIEVLPSAIYRWPFKVHLDTFIDRGTSRTVLPK